MTRVDGFGNRYELVEPKTFETPRGMVVVRKNNEKGMSHVQKDDWDRWENVRDSNVEQKDLEL